LHPTRSRCATERRSGEPSVLSRWTRPTLGLRHHRTPHRSRQGVCRGRHRRLEPPRDRLVDRGSHPRRTRRRRVADGDLATTTTRRPDRASESRSRSIRNTRFSRRNSTSSLRSAFDKPGFDIGLVHPTPQTRLRDLQIARELRDRMHTLPLVIDLPSKIDRTTTELRRMSSRHTDSFPEAYHLSASVRTSGGCSLLRDLTIDTSRDYQPTGRTTRRTQK